MPLSQHSPDCTGRWGVRQIGLAILGTALIVQGCATTSAAPGASPSRGAVTACAGYTDLAAARISDGRPLLEAFDSVYRAGKSNSATIGSGFQDPTTAQLLGQPTSPPQLSDGERQRMAQRFLRYYRRDLRDRGAHGEAVILALVDAQSKFQETRVVRSSGHASMDRAVISIMRETRLDPAVAGECSVPYFLQLPIGFKAQPGLP